MIDTFLFKDNIELSSEITDEESFQFKKGALLKIKNASKLTAIAVDDVSDDNGKSILTFKLSEMVNDDISNDNNDGKSILTFMKNR